VELAEPALDEEVTVPPEVELEVCDEPVDDAEVAMSDALVLDPVEAVPEDTDVASVPDPLVAALDEAADVEAVAFDVADVAVAVAVELPELTDEVPVVPLFPE
jgi:hypothetical protein